MVMIALQPRGEVSVFQTGDPVEIHFKMGNTCVTLHGKLVQMPCPLMGMRLTDSSGGADSLKRGMTVLIAIGGSTGVYSAEAVVQRCDPAEGQVVVSVNGSFRYQQRRWHERYRCDMQVRLRVVGDTKWISGVCRDISAGGARIYLSQEIELRSNTLEVVFLSPTNQQAVRAVGEVVRTSKLLDDSGWEIGVRFAEMNRMEKIHFARLLQQLGILLAT